MHLLRVAEAEQPLWGLGLGPVEEEVFCRAQVVPEVLAQAALVGMGEVLHPSHHLEVLLALVEEEVPLS